MAASGRNDRARSASKPSDASVKFGIHALNTFRQIAIRLIDREQVPAFLLFFVLVIIAIVAIRMPPAALGRIPDLLLAFLSRSGFVTISLSISLLASFVGNAILFATLRLGRKTYKAEIDRMANYKRELELRIDAKRPGTFELPEHAGSNEHEPAQQPKAKK